MCKHNASVYEDICTDKMHCKLSNTGEQGERERISNRGS
jgi:hypothetical protein